MKLWIIFIFLFALDTFASNPPKQKVYGRHLNSGFEGMSCKQILQNHSEATRYSNMPESPQMAQYFNSFFESGEGLCSKFRKSRAESVMESLGQLKDKVTPGMKVRESRDPLSQCLELSKLFAKEFYDGFEQLARIAQLRMTIYDSRLYETRNGLFSPGCSSTIGMNAIQPLASRLRSDKTMQDELLLSKIKYMTNDENVRCQVRSNAAQKDIKSRYSNDKDWEDRSLCQTFVNNWKEWKRLNTIPTKAATPDAPVESSTCKLSCDFFDPEKTRVLAGMSGNRCILDAYLECSTAGKIKAPASGTDTSDDTKPPRRNAPAIQFRQ